MWGRGAGERGLSGEREKGKVSQSSDIPPRGSTSYLSQVKAALASDFLCGQPNADSSFSQDKQGKSVSVNGFTESLQEFVSWCITSY